MVVDALRARQPVAMEPSAAIDCHVAFPQAGAGRDGAVGTLLSRLDADGLAGAVLIARDADPDILSDALAAAPERLRGVAALTPDIARGTLERLQGAGVAGLHLDLVGGAVPALSQRPWRTVIDMVGWRGLHLDVDAAGDQWTAILPPLLDAGVRVVIDHFGRPQGGPDCAGFRTILDAGRRGDVWVKLSAPDGRPPPHAADCTAALIAAFGPDRVVWGGGLQCGATTAALERLDGWIADPALRQRVRADNAADLYRFAAAPAAEPWTGMV